MFMAGPHGEYELIFSIAPSVQKEFETACKLENQQPVYLGKVIPEKQLSFTSESLQVQCNPAIASNLFYESNGDVQYYFDMLLQQHKNWLQQ
jgi:hypothetical protein